MGFTPFNPSYRLKAKPRSRYPLFVKQVNRSSFCSLLPAPGSLLQAPGSRFRHGFHSVQPILPAKGKAPESLSLIRRAGEPFLFLLPAPCSRLQAPGSRLRHGFHSVQPILPDAPCLRPWAQSKGSLLHLSSVASAPVLRSGSATEDGKEDAPPVLR